MKHKAQITISRPQYGDGRELIHLNITDVDARIEFVELEISYADFTRALTGQAYVVCDMHVRGLENVGKQRERDTITVEMPECSYYDRKATAVAEVHHHIKEGWTSSDYFGSQDSFYTKDNIQYAKTDIFRWIDKEQGE